MDVIDEPLLQCQLGLSEKEYQERLLLMDLHDPAREKAQRCEPVQPVVICSGDIDDPAALSRDKIAKRHDSRLDLLLGPLTAFASGNIKTVRAFGRVPQQCADMIGHFRREKMLERAGVRFDGSILSDIEHIDEKRLLERADAQLTLEEADAELGVEPVEESCSSQHSADGAETTGG